MVINTKQLPEKYEGGMPDGWYRQLSGEEEKEFRVWARKNYSGDCDSMWHPIVRHECYLMDAESNRG